MQKVSSSIRNRYFITIWKESLFQRQKGRSVSLNHSTCLQDAPGRPRTQSPPRRQREDRPLLVRPDIGMTALRLFVSYFAWLLPCAWLGANEHEFDTQAYLQAHCSTCHGANEQMADRRFDLLGTDFSVEPTAEQWQEILDVINLGEMPPEDEPQPTTTETKRFVSAVTGQLKAARESLDSKSRSHFRRLNRYEYRNTIRDLCGLNIDSFDPTASFPADDRFDGFENIGEQLVLSDYLLQCYLEAASRSVEKAAQANRTSEKIHEVFMPNDMCRLKFHFRPQVWFEVNVDGSFVDVAHSDRGLKRVYPGRLQGVPADGYYTIRITAEGINRKHPYSAKHMDVDRSEPIKMEVIVTDSKVAKPWQGQNTSDRIVATLPLKDHEADVYEIRTWMDKGFVPVIRYANGPAVFKRTIVRVAKAYHADTLPSNWRDALSDEPAEIKPVWISDAYRGPRMRIHQMELEGPEPTHHENSRRAVLFGEQSVATDSTDLRKTITRFLFRAFRRPPLASEVSRYIDFRNSRLQSGESEETALRTTLKAILCSPNFLYVEVPLDETQPKNHQFRIASRLSYFLWSSMPDQPLLEAAAREELSDPNVLVAQAIRMLKDPKAKAFAEHFTDSWLHLNELGAMPPDTLKFPTFHHRQLEPLMREETRLFFEEILTNNLSIEHFIDSNFTFVNRYLADHYGITKVVGDNFRRVSLPRHSLRGGLLGHASVLTVTSNGVETSPVTRGIWVLENILGTPPPPPPPDIEPLEPDIRGATTIRQQLAKHRDVATCAQCHRQIDPIGFALESFDPIGSFRQNYIAGTGTVSLEVDTSGKLPTGESFENAAELKRHLLNRKDQFARCLTEKMLTYALGRELGFRDRPHVTEIENELAARGYGLHDLVELIVSSAVFYDD